MKKSITIGSYEFKTKADAKIFLKSFLKTQPHKTVIKEKVDFLLALINLHPNPDYHVKSALFYVEHSLPNTHHLWFKYFDKKTNEKKRHKISWNKCLGLRKSTPKTNLNAAMRNCTKSQTDTFKASQPQVCVICKATDKAIHTDHYPTCFSQLAEDFFQETDLSLPAEFIDGDNGENCKFGPGDALFEHEWVLYHQKNATYRILCAPCNLSHKHESRQ